MSQFNSSMDVANPFAPLHQSLIRPGGRGEMDMQNPAQRLRAAQSLRMGRGGHTGMNPMGVQQGPMSDAVSKAKALVMQGLISDDDAPDELKSLRDDPHTDLNTFQRVAQQYAKGKAQQIKVQPQQQPQHNFSGQQADANPDMTAAGYAPGTMTVTRGHGPNAVSPDQMHQMAMRVNTNSFGGAVHNVNDLTAGQGGFQVSGMQPPQQADPIVDMVNQFKGHIPDETLAAIQQGINAGAIQPQHALTALQQAAQHQQASTRQAKMDQEHEQDRQHKLDTEKLGDLKSQEKELEGRDKNTLTPDPNVGKDLTAVREQTMNVRQRLMGGRGGQQQEQAPQQAGGIPRPPKPGAKLTPEAIEAISKIPGITRQAAEQMAQQNGWAL